MSDFELWQYLFEFSEMSNGWWYSVAALPATILAACTYLLMWFALRREYKLPKMFFWLVLASIPLIMILPSYYVSTFPQSALSRIGLPSPNNLQQISRATALQLGQYLSQLATLGIIGSSLGFVIIFASLMIGGYQPAIIERMSQTFTKTMTRVFGARRGVQVSASSRYGVVKVVRGQQHGTQFGVKNGALIGKENATMTITDDIVSRRHARFEIRNETTWLIDEGSTNGTYIERNGTTQELNGQSIQLEHGDKIYLGPPDEQKAVELAFEKTS